MLWKDGSPSIRYFIRRVLYWVFVLVIQCTLGLVSKLSRQNKDGCEKGCKLKQMNILQRSDLALAH